MKKALSNYIDKLFFKKWIIGIQHIDIGEIIRTKSFNPDIHWIHSKSFCKSYADPFLIKFDNDISILLEEFTFLRVDGKISYLTLDINLKQLDHKVLLDTKSHLSYPFVYKENEITYVFPESGHAGKLSCYKFDSENDTLTFIKDILDIPLIDSTFLMHDDKYWIFGILSQSGSYKLLVYYSDSLLGPYTPHPQNPIKSGLNGTRSAGSFIKVDGNIYRPTQNCKNRYGESITIQKVTELNEAVFSEKSYLDISIHKKKRHYSGMHTIHTINALNNIIIVDGERWDFSPFQQVKKFIIDTFDSIKNV